MSSFLPWLGLLLVFWPYVMEHVGSAVVESIHNPSITLSQGTSNLNGYLNMKTKNSEWISVCMNTWAGSYPENAKVACRQLHLGLPKSNLHWNNSLDTLASSEVVCSGDETDIQSCEYSEETLGNCSKDGQLWLECSGFQEIKLRLSGSDQFDQGRVEIYHNGRWGTICDQDWTISDASIVCKMYMNSNAIDAYKKTQVDGNDKHPVYIEDVTCTGNEESILDCDFKGLESMHECSQKDEVWVNCEKNIIISGGQSLSASLFTALSIIVLIFLLVLEYIALRRYQRWSAARRARRQNVNIRFQPLVSSNPHSPHDQISIGGAVQILGVDYPANRTSTLPTGSQSPVPCGNRIVNIDHSLVIEEPPPPYSGVSQNGTNTLNEASEELSIQVTNQPSNYSTAT